MASWRTRTTRRTPRTEARAPRAPRGMPPTEATATTAGAWWATSAQSWRSRCATACARRSSARRSKAVRCPWSPRTRTSRTPLGPSREARRARGRNRTTPTASGYTPPRHPCSLFAAPTPSTRPFRRPRPTVCSGTSAAASRPRRSTPRIRVDGTRSLRGSRRARMTSPSATLATRRTRRRRQRRRRRALRADRPDPLDGRCSSSPRRSCTSS
mmetsp:Transcript_11758/g.50382  ORF Transcript_11758/g.50382 Transcript_11758/m.50382 type:complete len:213 (-) Transcript_11758:1011-1649(-)